MPENQLQGLVDVHCHMIPNVDDGSKSIGESLAVLTMEANQGVSDIIMTPHSWMTDGIKAREAFDLLVEQAKANESTSKLNLHLGMEVFVESNMLEKLSNGKNLLMGDSKYVLLEFHPNEKVRDIHNYVKTLQLEGYRIVIAHVERYNRLKIRDIEALSDAGVLMQVNSSSLIGKSSLREKLISRKATKLGLVSLLGSDSHNESDRKPTMKEGYEMLIKLVGEELANQIAINKPRTLLEGKLV